MNLVLAFVGIVAFCGLLYYLMDLAEKKKKKK